MSNNCLDLLIKMWRCGERLRCSKENQLLKIPKVGYLAKESARSAPLSYTRFFLAIVLHGLYFPFTADTIKDKSFSIVNQTGTLCSNSISPMNHNCASPESPTYMFLSNML